MDLIIPYVFLLYSSQFAQQVQFDEKYFTMDFNIEHFGFLKKSQLKLLKQIKQSFGPETNEAGDQAVA